MNAPHNELVKSGYWERQNLGQMILDAMVTTGHDLERLSIDDLAPFDQFHSGGKAATIRLASLAPFSPGMRVLDVGGGLGGPARTLAVEYGCDVTVVDLTESYVEAARMLTERVGLADRVTHHVGNALELGFEDASFDVVWTQNSGMNIADKERLYSGFHRVLRPQGLLVFQEPMNGPVQPIIFPTMWATDDSSSFLRSPDAMLDVITKAGFRSVTWDVFSLKPAPAPTQTTPALTIVDLVMGDHTPVIDHANVRNREEHRMVMAHAVFVKA